MGGIRSRKTNANLFSISPFKLTKNVNRQLFNEYKRSIFFNPIIKRWTLMFLFSFYFKIKVQPKQFSFFFKTKHKFLFFLSISKSRNPKYQIVNHVTWNSIKNNRYIKNRRDHTTYLFFVYTMMKNNWKKWEGSQTNEKLNLNYLIETIISILLSSTRQNTSEGNKIWKLS